MTLRIFPSVRQRRRILLAAAALALPTAALAEDLTLDCVVDPSQQVKLGSPVTGILSEVLVTRGDFVKAGDVVARLESGVEQAAVDLGKARADSNEDIEAQKTRLGVYRDKLERSRKLAEQGHVTAGDMEQIEADEKIAESDLARLVEQKRFAELDLARAEASLDERTIRSPINALVSDRRLSPGEFVNQDSYVVTLVALDPLHVETFVPVAQWGRIKAGMTGTVALEEPIGGAYPATVTIVDQLFDAASGTFGVRLELSNPERTLPAGLRCKVTFDLPDLTTPGQ